MSHPARIATVILNYRTPADTVRAVERVRAGTVAGGRLIVVDNGPDDAAHADLRARLGSDAECVASGDNLGYAGGNNVGIRLALQGDPEFVWILNPDARVAPGALEWLLATARERPDAGTLGARLLLPGGRRIQCDGGMVDDTTHGTPRHLNHGLVARETPATAPREVDYVNGACLLIRAPVFEAVGLLPEEYFLYFEETAFCREAQAAGWRNLHEPRARVVHELRSRPSLPTPRYLYYLTRNRLYFARRYFGAEPDAVLPHWEETFLRRWREATQRDAPGWLVTFDAVVERAVADARAGTTGRVPDVEDFPDPPAAPDRQRTEANPTTAPNGERRPSMQTVRHHAASVLSRYARTAQAVRRSALPRRFPAGRPRYPEPTRRAAIVQMEAVHEECVPALAHLLRANGVDVTVFLNARIKRLRGDVARVFPALDGRTHYVPLAEEQHWWQLADRLGEFDLLAFNTFQSPGVTTFARRLGKPVLGAVHNPLLFLRTEDGPRMARSGQAQLLSLAPHVTAWMLAHDAALFSRVGTITSAFPDLPEVPRPVRSGRRRLTVPGAVNFNARDYPGLVAALQEMPEVDRDAFEIAVVGGGPDRERLQGMVADAGLADCFSFAALGSSGFVRNRTYYTQLARSAMLLPVLPERVAPFRTYKITSALPVSLGLGIPSIVDRWTESVYRLPCLSYAADEMPAGLRRALLMPDEELDALRGRVRSIRDLTLDHAVDEVGRALAQLERGPVARPARRPVHDGLGELDRESSADFLRYVHRVLPSSYAQRFQDLWALWEAGFATAGYFVEFGALNGKAFSNTYLLERLGWKGTVAEPHPDYAEHLHRNRTCTISTKCVYDKSGDSVTFRAVRGRPALSAVAGFGNKDKGALLEDFDEYDVETVSLTDLLDEVGAPRTIDFLSIDTEGSEPLILRAFDFEAYDIRTICVEHNGHQREELYELLTAKGYRRKWSGISGHDDWYVRDPGGSGVRWSDADLAAALRAADEIEPFETLINERRALLKELEPVPSASPDVDSSVCTFEVEGTSYTFHVANQQDAIQGAHHEGRLFDHDELLVIAAHLRDGDVVVDVGANVGNHAIYLAKRFPASRVVVVEPSAEAAALLRENVSANGCSNIDLRWLGHAFSDRRDRVYLQRGGPNNLGDSKIVAIEGLDSIPASAHSLFQEVELVAGDEALEGLAPALIKVDVQGHEFQVLEGLAGTIARCRPRLFVEIRLDALNRLEPWLRTTGYEVVWTEKHAGRIDQNYLLAPAESHG